MAVDIWVKERTLVEALGTFDVAGEQRHEDNQDITQHVDSVLRVVWSGCL